MSEKIRNYTEANEKNESQEFKNQLWSLQKELLANLDIHNEKLNQVREQLRNLLKKNSNPWPLDLSFYVEIAKIEENLYSPELKDNENAKILQEVVNLINLDTSWTKEDIVNQISKVFNNPKISLYTKHQLANFLKEHYLWELTQKVWDWYMADPGKSVEVINELTKKFPNYEWDNSVLIADPEWWYVYTNNF